MNRSRRATLWILIAGVLAVTVYAAWAALQILVLNPLAAVPGKPLEQIYAEMALVGEDPGVVRVVVILGLGVIMAIVVAAVSIRASAPPVVPGMTFLALLSGGVPAYFVASFGAGMALADTFMIGGGDASPWAIPLYAVSAASAIAVIVASIGLALRHGRPTTVPQAA